MALLAINQVGRGGEGRGGVYLYITHYATSVPDMALLAINQVGREGGRGGGGGTSTSPTMPPACLIWPCLPSTRWGGGGRGGGGCTSTSPTMPPACLIWPCWPSTRWGGREGGRWGGQQDQMPDILSAEGGVQGGRMLYCTTSPHSHPLLLPNLTQRSCTRTAAIRTQQCAGSHCAACALSGYPTSWSMW